MNPSPNLPPGITTGSPADLARLVAQLQNDQAKLNADLLALQRATAPQTPGLPACQKRQTFAYSVEIPLKQGSTQRTPGTFSVSQDGPFVALALQAAWRETQGAYAGRWMPPSSEELYIRAAGSFNFANPPRPDPVDFEYEITDGNSDRNWQDKPIPSSFLYSVAGQPAYLPVPGVFPTNSTVTVTVTPIRPVTADGILKFTFWGYKALGLPQGTIG